MKTNYFLLPTEVPAFGGAGTTSKNQPFYFLGVLLGALAKVLYDHFASAKPFQWGQLLVAAIASIVTFPTIYKSAGLSRKGQITFAKWCIAFQYGFFWQSVIEMAGAKIG